MILPAGFLQFISQHPELEVLASGLASQPETSLRINDRKLSDYLPQPGMQNVAWCTTGFYLPERPTFTFDPHLHQGLYYVQDASSMAIVAAIRQITQCSQPVRYLDACASPGGKTTAALSALPDGSVVVANEYDYRRAEILAENISKWGNPNVVVSRGDTSRLSSLRNTFDIVAVDAPCSGEGMMRKDPKAVEQWSPALIEQCAATQRDILSNVWPALRPGGYLIYSTCTFNLAEDEDMLRWIVDTFGAEPVTIKALDDDESVVKGIDTPYPCYRFLPGRVRGEGLFMAVLKKPGVSVVANIDSRDKTSGKSQDYASISKWFDVDMDYLAVNDTVYALPRRNAGFMRSMASKLDTILVGCSAATIKGRDILPNHQAALCTELHTEAFEQCTLSYADAIRYLQRDSVILPADTPRGVVLLMYDGHPLGFVKNLGNRSNSMLPKAWRIISQNVPSEKPQII